MYWLSKFTTVVKTTAQSIILPGQIIKKTTTAYYITRPGKYIECSVYKRDLNYICCVINIKTTKYEYQYRLLPDGGKARLSYGETHIRYLYSWSREKLTPIGMFGNHPLVLATYGKKLDSVTMGNRTLERENTGKWSLTYQLDMPDTSV